MIQHLRLCRKLLACGRQLLGYRGIILHHIRNLAHLRCDIRNGFMLIFCGGSNPIHHKNHLFCTLDNLQQRIGRRVGNLFSIFYCCHRLIRAVVFLEAIAVLSARLRISRAITANPVPSSPTLAASTEAFKASKFVSNAIS